MFALGHNGNLVNTEALAKEAGMFEGTVTSDSDLVAELIGAELAALADADGRRWPRTLAAAPGHIEGGAAAVDRGRRPAASRRPWRRSCRRSRARSRS